MISQSKLSKPGCKQQGTWRDYVPHVIAIQYGESAWPLNVTRAKPRIVVVF